MTSRSLLLVNKFMYSFKHTWIQVPVLQLAGFVSLGKMVLSLPICKVRRSQYLFWGDIWRFNKNKVKMQIPVCYMCKCCNVVSLLFLAYKVPGPGLYSGQGWGCRGGTSMKVIPVMEERQVLHLSCHLRFKSMTGLWQEVISLGDGDSPSTPHDFLGPRFKSHEVWQSLVSLRAPCPYNRAPSCPLV